MQDNLIVILTAFRAGVWATQKSKKIRQKASTQLKVLLKIPNFGKLPFFLLFTPLYCLLNIYFTLNEKVVPK